MRPVAVRAAQAGPGARRTHLSLLVVDGDEAAARLTKELAGQPVQVRVARDAADALLMVGRACPDVLVLGPVPGRLDPLALIEVLREHEPQLPVVVGVGAADGEFAARATALEPAAVIHHPYRPDHLLRLVQSFAPVDWALAVGPPPIDLGRLWVDGTSPEIQIDGVHQVLPLREFLVLRFLAERVGRVVSRAEISEAVWGTASAGTTNTLAVHITRLRRRFGGGHAGARWISAVRRVGYQLSVPPVEGQPDDPQRR